MHYSIIIPAYNEEKLLPGTLKCLNKIKEDLKKDFSGEIIVVDNNSTDNTAKIAQKFNAEIVFEKDNCIAKARNAGAKAAKGNFLIFVDADTIVSYDLVRKSLDMMDKSELCGGGTIISFDEENIPLSLRFFSWLWHMHIKFSPLAAGSYVFCLKEAWKDVGGFNDKIYASEEIWFSLALRKWGEKRKLKFAILDIPVITSARKIHQYSTFRLLSVVFILTIFPWGVRNRKFCRVWYERGDR